MALRECKECGADVSTKAKTCPRCGVPEPTDSRPSKTFTGCVGCLLLVVGVAVTFSMCDRSLDARGAVHRNPTRPARQDDRSPKLFVTTLDEKEYDAPVKTQIEYSALVTGEVTEDNLEDALLINPADQLRLIPPVIAVPVAPRR